LIVAGGEIIPKSESLFQKIKNKFNKKTYPGFSPYIQSQLWWLNSAVYSPAQYRTFAAEGYMTNPVVYRCINLIATAIAGIPWKLYRRVADNKDIHIENSPVLDLLNQPNPRMGQADFFTDLISYLQLSGNTYVRRVGPSNGAPKELYLLRPDRMTINEAEFNDPCYDDIYPVYMYECNNLKERIDPRWLWHGKLWNPLCDFYGMSPLQAAGKSIDQLNLSLDWNVALLQNSANPSGVLTSEGNLTDEQISRLKEQLAVKYQSSINAGRPMLLEGGLTWAQMSLNPKDMQWDLGVKNATKFISMALGVDTSLLGDSSISTYSNFKDAEKAFYTSTVLPNMDRLRDDFLNGWLLPLFPNMEDYYFEYDRDGIEVLGEDRTIVWDRSMAGFEAGLISLNEARDAIGYTEKDETSAPDDVEVELDFEQDEVIDEKKK